MSEERKHREKQDSFGRGESLMSPGSKRIVQQQSLRRDPGVQKLSFEVVEGDFMIQSPG